MPNCHCECSVGEASPRVAECSPLAFPKGSNRKILGLLLFSTRGCANETLRERFALYETLRERNDGFWIIYLLEHSYAIRIQGNFPYLKFRSVPKQTPPYRPLADALKEQSIFELKNVNGTLVGFRTPKYMQGVNLNGYHFHFITANRKSGGHILDGQFKNAKIEVDTISNVQMNLPQTAEFEQANLGDAKSDEINKIVH
jgi:alpha-acetolactate decarboxylase